MCKQRPSEKSALTPQPPLPQPPALSVRANNLKPSNNPPHFMPNRQTEVSQTTPTVKQNREKQHSHKNQHGEQIRILLDIPSETLTGITSHLDPQSLLHLSLVNRRLYEHVKDDNTWHRALVNHCLGISPESDLYDPSKRLLLRRFQSSWRKEFISRYHLTRLVALSP